MRKLGMLVCLLTVGAWASQAMGAITIDGSVADWNSAYIYTDPSSDNSPGYVEMLSWGAVVEDGYLYWFCEISQNWTDFQGYEGTKAKAIYPGLWIDADASTSTFLKDGATPNCADASKKEWATNHRGIDINMELGIRGNWVNGVNTNSDPAGEGPGGSQYNYWGDNGDVATAPVTAVSDGSWCVSGGILEARVNLAELTAKIESLPDFNGEGKADVGDYWMVAVGVQGTNQLTGEGGITYGYDVGTPRPTGDPIGGDANLDDVVDLLDLGVVGDNWGSSGALTVQFGDFNYDGTVDLLDLGTVGDNWGATGAGEPLGSPSATPEPMTLSLLGIGALALLRRRSL